jgi:hypothetical protein
VPIEVYIHFDFDDFQPDLMEDLRLKGLPAGKFQISRMLPQQICLYFFSISGSPFLNSKSPQVAVDENIKLLVAKTFSNQTLRHPITDVAKLKEYALKEMHVILADSLVTSLLAQEQHNRLED